MGKAAMETKKVLRCRMCQEEMKEEKFRTSQYLLWYCLKCGYWDCTKQR